MYDMGLSVLEQYELSAERTYKGRGALVCVTNQGLYLIKEARGTGKGLEIQRTFQEKLMKEEICKTDVILQNKEGSCVSTDAYGETYMVKKWFEGKECDTKSQEDILCASEFLGLLHNSLHIDMVKAYRKGNRIDEMQRHNQELRKIRSFIRRKQTKNTFEYRFLEEVEWFLEAGEEALGHMDAEEYARLRAVHDERGSICHGDYNQHNVLYLKPGKGIINFDKWNFDCPITDLYLFMRKILEKHNWNIALAEQMLDAYEQEYKLTLEEWRYLWFCFAYPEKFWKIANYYYNHNKAWIAGKNYEKLQEVVRQKTNWVKFLSSHIFDFLF